MLRRDLTTGTGRTWSGGGGWDWTTRLGRAGRERGGGEDCDEREREGGDDLGKDDIEAPGGHSTGCER